MEGERLPQPARLAVDPTLVVFLSLYLLLLTLFIMLSATSQSEGRRVALAIFGIETTFRGGATGVVHVGGPGGNGVGPKGEIIDVTLRKALNDVGFLESLDFTNRDGEVLIDLPLSALFRSGSFDAELLGITLISALSHAVRDESGVRQYIISVSLGRGATELEAGPELATRAHALAARLAAVDPDIRIGSEPMSEPRARLILRPVRE